MRTYPWIAVAGIACSAAFLPSPGGDAWSSSSPAVETGADDAATMDAAEESPMLNGQLLQLLTELAATDPNHGLLYVKAYSVDNGRRLGGVRITTSPPTSVTYTRGEEVENVLLEGANMDALRDSYNEYNPLPFGTCVIQGVPEGTYEVSAELETFSGMNEQINVRGGAVSRVEFWLNRTPDLPNLAPRLRFFSSDAEDPYYYMPPGSATWEIGPDPGVRVYLGAYFEDLNGDDLRVTWTATGGHFLSWVNRFDFNGWKSTMSASVVWSASPETGTYRITLTCEDRDGASRAIETMVPTSIDIGQANQLVSDVNDDQFVDTNDLLILRSQWHSTLKP